MLQITTGKLFQRPTQRENSLRGVLYTNLHLEYMADQACAIPALGRLVQSSELGAFPRMLIFEFVERLEKAETGPDLIISHGADSYVRDMSMLISLVFNCTCSPDIDLARRLIGNQRGEATGRVPNSLVSRVFDKDVFCQPSDSQQFVDFVTHLLKLERRTFLSVMRAIRTYVTGLHRIADDLELAYTLLVAAGESLTQDFDGYTSDWQSIPEQKRIPMDEALEGVDAEVANRVRNTMISIEHVALGRRFQAFVAKHVSGRYFEGPFDEGAFPPGRGELSELLGAAYQARSQYVHQLLRLPDAVTQAQRQTETVLPVFSRQRMLTLHGLARLIRHVIIEFVRSQPTVEKEEYDYRYEVAGVKMARLGSGAWIANSDGDIKRAGRAKLEGFLDQISGALLRLAGAEVSDIAEVLKKFLAAAPQFSKVERLPYWVMYAIFNSIAGARSAPLNPRLNKLIDADFEQPSVEMLLVYAYFRHPLQCSLEDHKLLFDTYKKKRSSKSGVRFPRLFEAAIGLELAERYRVSGDFASCEKTAILAADDFPEHNGLREWVRKMAPDDVVSWHDILLEKQTQAQIQQSATVGRANDRLSRAKQRLKARRQSKYRNLK